MTEVLPSRGRQRIRRGRIRHVAGDGDHLGTVGANGVDGLVQHVSPTAVEHQLGALLGEPVGDG